MSMKPYILRGKTSTEMGSFDLSSEYRKRSSQRGYSTGRTSPYKSEFDLDGSIHRRSTFYSPPRLSPRSSRAYLAAKAAALGLPRSGGVSEWSRDTGSSGWSQPRSPELPHFRSTRGSDVDGPHANSGRRERGSGGGGASGSGGASPSFDETRPRDLKRKMVFDLHKEINKSNHTTHLEEISDMDKITDICFSNLRVMMENKKHRKYLHHMNNNAIVTSSSLLLEEGTSMNNYDFTNNSGADRRSSSKEHMGSANAKRFIQDGTLARKASMKPAEMIQAVSPIDPLKVRGPRPSIASMLRNKSFTEKPSSSKTKIAPAGINAELKHQQPLRLSLGAIQEKEDSTVSFLAELEDQIESAKKEGPFRNTTKHVPLMTPEEILACHYIRLNQDQVARLEQCIRDKGKDPGIHVHMDVSNYDVFGEIRRIRQAQSAEAVLDEEDEECVAPHKQPQIPFKRSSGISPVPSLASAGTSGYYKRHNKAIPKF